jgi:catechol-2,3-dioxygenase
MSRALAHFGVRTRRFEALLRWYGDVLGARVLFQNDWAAFLTFDDEHHRLVIWTDEATRDRDPDSACIDHLCIALPDFEALAARYERLKRIGVLPSLTVNHRFTTSLYYRDPDGNELEFSVDNFATKEEGTAFVCSEAMAAILVPPFGDAFDPEELLTLVRAGASREQLVALGRGPLSG